MSQRMAHWHEWHGQPHTESKIQPGLHFHCPHFCECMFFLRSLNHQSDKLSEPKVNSATDLLCAGKYMEAATVFNQSLGELVKGTQLKDLKDRWVMLVVILPVSSENQTSICLGHRANTLIIQSASCPPSPRVCQELGKSSKCTHYWLTLTL